MKIKVKIKKSDDEVWVLVDDGSFSFNAINARFDWYLGDQDQKEKEAQLKKAIDEAFGWDE